MSSRFWAAAAAVLPFFLGAPAQACLSCGCGGSGSSGDLGAVGGAASFFSMGHRWLVQEGVSMRDITGSFNERGTWNPTPVDGSLRTVQTTLGLSYFPTVGTSFGIQLPLVANALNGATWGPMGSVAPTDLPRATGAGVGDVMVQGSARLWEGDIWALAGWGGASAPTGYPGSAPVMTAAGTLVSDPQNLTGAGVWSGQAGLLAIAQPGDWELSANLGLQRPFARPTLQASTFYVGDAVLYQLQANYRLNDAFRVGLGLNGYRGEGRFGPADLAVPMAKLKLVPSVHWAWNGTEGVRIAVGADPAALGTNAMTDLSVYAVFYQFIP